MAYGMFHTKKSHRKRNVIITVCILICLFALFIFAISTVRTSSISTQEENLTAALERDITDCYATTGSYPTSLDEIKDKYNLVYNEKLFFIDYQVRGSNIRPEVTVLRKNTKSEDPGILPGGDE